MYLKTNTINKFSLTGNYKEWFSCLIQTMMVTVMSSISTMTALSESPSCLIVMQLFSLWTTPRQIPLQNCHSVSVTILLTFEGKSLLETFLAKNFARIPQLEVSLKENSGLRVRNDFQRFIGTLMSSQSERLEQVEMNIMRGWKFNNKNTISFL